MPCDALENRRARYCHEHNERDQYETRRPHRDARQIACFPMRPMLLRARHHGPRSAERVALSDA